MSLIGTEVTVLGAGVAGLAIARALALSGADVTVLEQAEAIREVGAGLQISPNGAAVLRALGLGEALETASMRAQAVQLHDGKTGKLVLKLDLARLRPGQGYHLMHRADLIDLLAEGARAAGVHIRLLQKIESVDLSSRTPRIVTAQGAEYMPGLLIGADGLHSLVRSALNGPSEPFFTHQVAWRAVIPAEPGEPVVAEVHMGDGRHLVSYPMRGGTQRNIVAVEERRRWVQEGWTLRDDPVDLQLAFSRFNGRVRHWLEQVPDVWLWGLFRHPVAPAWYRGNACILGDAAHPTLPFLAQGANMALEDAWVLADCLTTYGIQAGLAAYEERRVPRCRKVVQAANNNARAYHLKSPIKDVAHLGLKIGSRLLPGITLNRLEWLYGHDVTKLDVTTL